jgi:hypothetical protein
MIVCMWISYSVVGYLFTELLGLFKPFQLELGGIGKNKSDNLKHAREMLLKAARGDGNNGKRPNLMVLPVDGSIYLSAILLLMNLLLGSL